MLCFYIPKTVPETFYVPSWMVSERWAHAERTVSTLWANGGWMLNGIWWALVNSQHDSANTGAKWMVNGRWTICERYVKARWSMNLNCLGRYPYIVIRRYSGENYMQKWMYCYQLKYYIIWLNDKRMLNKRWVQGEYFVNTWWALCERLARTE